MIISGQRQLRHVFSVTSGATPDSNNNEFWDGDIWWVTPEDISSLDGYWLKETRRKITLAGYKSCGTTLAPIKSIVLSKRAPIGQLAILAVESCSNQGCFLLSPLHGADTRFFYYWLSSKLKLLQALGRGSTFMELSTDDLKSLKVPHPSLSEQRIIADYLDYETTRLDGLVLTKERLLELLAEKRRAIINRTVTCSLDPDVLLRDSGLPWPAQIPKEWDLLKLKWLVTTVESGVSVNATDQPSETGCMGVLKTSAVLGGLFYPNENKAVWDSEINRVSCPVKRNSIIMSRMNTPSLVAESGYVERDYPDLYLPDRLWQILFNTRRVYTPFMALLLASSGARDSLSSMATGTSGSMKNLSKEEMLSLTVPLPSIPEQQEIVVHISNETSKIDSLLSATKSTIALLKERREALIAAVVTGKVKVD